MIPTNKTLDDYLSRGIGNIEVIANCFGDLPISPKTKGEFKTMTEKLMNTKVIGVLFSGGNGLETFYQAPFDSNIYVVKTYHQSDRVITVFGKLVR